MCIRDSHIDGHKDDKQRGKVKEKVNQKLSEILSKSSTSEKCLQMGFKPTVVFMLSLIHI